jgi:Tol biopolymer transport system component
VAALSPHRGALLSSLTVCGALFCGGCGASASSQVPLTEGEGVWAPDGKAIARGIPGGVEIADQDGRRTRLIPIRTPTRGVGWSADNRTLFFLSKEAHQKPDRTDRLGSVPAAGGQISWVPLNRHAGGIAWSPGGWPLAFTTAYLAYRIGYGPVGPEPALWTKGGPHRRSHRILDLPGEELAPHWSPDGRSILITVRHRRSDELWTVDAGGGHGRLLAAGLSEPEASWSPDGKWVAVSGFAPNGSDRRQHLYVIPAGGGRLRQLTTEEVRSGEPPAWTPDGNWITYATYEGEVKEIHPDGTGMRTIADFPHEEVRGLAWSPDGTHLAYRAEPIVESD